MASSRPAKLVRSLKILDGTRTSSVITTTMNPASGQGVLGARGFLTPPRGGGRCFDRSVCSLPSA
jgi:hypothetical protein